MSPRKTVLLTGVALIFAASSAEAQNGIRVPPARAEVIPNQYICAFASAYVPGRGVRAEAERAAGQVGGRIRHVYANSIRGFSLNASEQAIFRMLAMNPNVAYCEPDQVMRLDPIIAGPPPGKGPGKGGDGGSGGTSTQSTPWGIARVNGGVSYAGGQRAWIIDTGIDGSHPDLNVDATNSRSFGNNSDWADRNGHGTHVAGTVAAVDNAFGVIGVAAGAPVAAVRVLEANGSGSYSNVIAGVDYVGAEAAAGDVANMSLGGPVSQALDDAVKGAAANGVRFTIAAGNSSANANNYSPARANGGNIFTISAFKSGDKWASFSNYGNPPIDYAEPGQAIESTWKGGGYKTISGTSMAAPHAAGLLLLGAISSGGTVPDDPDPDNDTIGVH